MGGIRNGLRVYGWGWLLGLVIPQSGGWEGTTQGTALHMQVDEQNATAEALILLSASTKPLMEGSTVNKARSKRAFGFPGVIKDLPEADMPFPGVKAWILQGEKHQLIFFEMQPTAVVPEHSHRYPQWGMVVEGTMKLIINGKTRTINKGDDYLIPAEATHQAKFLTKTQVIDLFSERTRYKTKPTKRARAPYSNT